MTSARQACETLLQDALDGGGSDNITIVVGRQYSERVEGAGSRPHNYFRLADLANLR